MAVFDKSSDSFKSGRSVAKWGRPPHRADESVAVFPADLAILVPVATAKARLFHVPPLLAADEFW